LKVTGWPLSGALSKWTRRFAHAVQLERLSVNPKHFAGHDGIYPKTPIICDASIPPEAADYLVIKTWPCPGRRDIKMCRIRRVSCPLVELTRTDEDQQISAAVWFHHTRVVHLIELHGNWNPDLAVSGGERRILRMANCTGLLL
jgi:hypothetical protein